MIKVVPPNQLKDFIGQALEPTEWFKVEQDRINNFADTTLDHQFIHVDREKAGKTPFGTTIAHGYLTLSLLPHFMSQSGIIPEGVQMAVNYGLDKLRFLQPVKVNSEIRAIPKLLAVNEKAPGQYLCKVEVTVEIKNEEKPALIAETLSLFYVG